MSGGDGPRRPPDGGGQGQGDRTVQREPRAPGAAERGASYRPPAWAAEPAPGAAGRGASYRPPGPPESAPPASEGPPAEAFAVAETIPSIVPGPAASRRVGAGRVLGGKYNLVRLLGEGGMGAVYEAEHVLLGVPVAVKTMHPHLAASADSRRRFLREARAASRLVHRNVVKVLDLGGDEDEDDGVIYLVMELLKGQSLGAWLRASRELPGLEEVASIFADILDGVGAAHASGIVHRDLKPENVLVVEQDGERVAKVVDFGLAHLDDPLDAGPTLTSKDMVAGTPEYMSPEQCRSLAVGPSADLYACGCILTALLQGRPPFTGLPPIELMAMHMFSIPPPLARPPGAPPVPPLLERLRLDLLAKLPQKRPESAAAARSRLAEAMSREAESRRLPTRKGDAPLGERIERAPRWPEGETSQLAPAAEHTVALLRLAPAGEGLSEACEIGLDAQGIHLAEVPDAAALAESGLGMAVVDAGPDVDAACALLAALARAAPGVRAVVCAAGLSSDRMNALVEAGAADVVRYPVAPDVLSRKIARVVRRGR
ncbi:serine/threonine-protein kinase [Sorangium sp. So ce131]|uniref:serine/threonine-protein kinase n=1 Tax=Sorangium sp. So ce131 TaxID=3133282 RepID=UPI003F603F46